MKGFLSRLGIGAAEVDLSVDRSEVAPGDEFEVSIDVGGGSASQSADAVYLKVAAAPDMQTSVERDAAKTGSRSRKNTRRLLTAVTKATGTEDSVDPFSECTVDYVEIEGPVTIRPGERRTLTPTVEIPYRTPLTMGGFRVWIGAGLAVSAARDPSDRAYVEVVPDAWQETLFGAAEALGFEYADASMTTDFEAWGNDSLLTDYEGPYQSVRYRPVTGPYAGRFDAVDFHLDPLADDIEVGVEPDPASRSLSHEERPKLLVDGTDRDAVRRRLEAILDRW